jgi:DNA-binding MarR family transcriptional regulator
MLNHNKQSLSDDEKKVVNDLLNAVAILRAKNPKMTLQQLTALLLVAAEEGQQVVKYASRAGIAQGVMTRHLFDLGAFSRTREEGLGLVEQRPDLMDRRSHLTYLTHAGRRLLHDIIRAVRR